MRQQMDTNYFHIFLLELEKINKMFDEVLIQLDNKVMNHTNKKVNEINSIFQEMISVKDETTDRLLHEFLPPIEREDIYQLSTNLFQCSYAMKKINEGLRLPISTVHKQELFELYQVLRKNLDGLTIVFNELENFKKSKIIMGKVKEIRNSILLMDKELVNVLLRMTNASRNSLEISNLSYLVNGTNYLNEQLLMLIIQIEEMIIKNS